MLTKPKFAKSMWFLETIREDEQRSQVSITLQMTSSPIWHPERENEWESKPYCDTQRTHGPCLSGCSRVCKPAHMLLTRPSIHPWRGWHTSFPSRLSRSRTQETKELKQGDLSTEPTCFVQMALLWRSHCHWDFTVERKGLFCPLKRN